MKVRTKIFFFAELNCANLFRFDIGGAPGSVFHSSRYSTLSGLNSPNLDFLPVQNIEDVDVVVEGVGAVPVGKIFDVARSLFYILVYSYKLYAL